MSRLPLIHIPFGLYSVVSKCNNDEFHFNAHEKFILYLEHLLKCKQKLGFTLYDICCMSNHVHELYRVPKDVTIALILHRVKGQFAKKYNERFGRTGHFWRNKPFYRIIEDEKYAYNTIHYFHMNPVRAGIVKLPEEWPYSGYRFHNDGLKEGIIGRLLEPIPGYSSLKVDASKLKTIEKVIRSSKGRYIGSKAFQKKMRQQFGHPSRKCPTPT